MSLVNRAVKLNNGNLLQLQHGIRVPTYDRSCLIQNTVHIGVGGFHRAHQAVYLDDLLNLRDFERWGECGVGVLKSDSRMRDALEGQNHLYTMVERSAGKQEARVIGSMVDYIYAPENIESAIERMAAPDTRIVSLTITEGGYFINEATGEFMPEHPSIEHDVANPDEPISSMGFIAAAMNLRRNRGLPPFTVMSCDNLQGNGHVARKVLLGLTELQDITLHLWIADHAAFPNSMVDRITPTTTTADVLSIKEEFELDDAWPVVTEPFRQWVIEEEFCNGRPLWERVGAQVVSDVAPYELMKIRLLNASHMAMAYLGALAGYTYAHEVMQDALFKTFIEEFMREVTPVVPRIPGISITDYKTTLIQRFSNPTINDQVARLCSEGSAKMPKWVIPSIQELMREGRSAKLLSLVIAGWIYYLRRGIDEQGKSFEVVDARAAELKTMAAQVETGPCPMLAVKSIFGEHLISNKEFAKGIGQALQDLATLGVASTLRQYLSN